MRDRRITLKPKEVTQRHILVINLRHLLHWRVAKIARQVDLSVAGVRKVLEDYRRGLIDDNGKKIKGGAND